MADLEIKSFLGRGWSFPPTFTKGTKAVEMLSDLDDIKSSLDILLHTRLGERVMRPEFGGDIEDQIFEPMDAAQKSLIMSRITDNIYLFEPRITPGEITFEEFQNEGLILMNIEFTVRATNSRSNIVYPFYIVEGTNVK